MVNDWCTEQVEAGAKETIVAVIGRSDARKTLFYFEGVSWAVTLLNVATAAPTLGRELGHGRLPLQFLPFR